MTTLSDTGVEPLEDDLEWARWLGSMEGVPDAWPDATSDTAAGETSVTAGYRFLDFSSEIVPGLALATLLALAGKFLGTWLGEGVMGPEKSPISAITVAILLGLFLRNAIGLPKGYLPGLRVCMKRILRIGIALLGIRLSLLAAGRIGLIGFPIVVGCIASALLVVSWVNRAFGLPRRLGSLIAVGTSICGVSAIVASAPHRAGGRYDPYRGTNIRQTRSPIRLGGHDREHPLHGHPLESEAIVDSTAHDVRSGFSNRT